MAKIQYLTKTQERLLQALLRAPHIPEGLLEYATVAPAQFLRFSDVAFREDLTDEQFDIVWAACSKNFELGAVAAAAALRAARRRPALEAVAEMVSTLEPSSRRDSHLRSAARALISRTPPGHPLREALTQYPDARWLAAVTGTAAHEYVWDVAAPGLAALDLLASTPGLSDDDLDTIRRAGRGAMERFLSDGTDHLARIVTTMVTPALLPHWLADTVRGSVRGEGVKHAAELGDALVARLFLPLLTSELRILSFQSVSRLAAVFTDMWTETGCLAVLAQAQVAATTMRTKTGRRVAAELKERAAARLADLRAAAVIPSDVKLSDVHDQQQLSDWLIDAVGEVHGSSGWAAVMALIASLGEDVTVGTATAAIAGVTAA